MNYEINSAFKLITEQFALIDDTDVYYINPFDLNGFVIPQMNIEVRLQSFNGNPILFIVPPVNSFKGQYNFKIEIVVSSLELTPNPIAYAFNMEDNGNASVFYNAQGEIIVPIGLLGTANLAVGLNAESGFWSVIPYNQPPSPLASPMINTMSATETVTPMNLEELRALLKTLS